MALSPESEEQLQSLRRRIEAEERQKARRKKPLNIYKIAKKTLKDFKEEEEYKKNIQEISKRERERRYLQTRTGRISRAVASGFRAVGKKHGVIRGVGYRNSLEPDKRKLSKQEIQQLRLEVQKLRILKQLRMQQQPQQVQAQPITILQRLQAGRELARRHQEIIAQQQRVEFENTFATSYPEAVMLEREIHSVANEPNTIGRSIGWNEALGVERQAFAVSNFQHTIPIAQIENEVLAQGNILNPYWFLQGQRVRKAK